MRIRNVVLITRAKNSHTITLILKNNSNTGEHKDTRLQWPAMLRIRHV